MLTAGLFISLFAVFFLLFVSLDRYEVSPATRVIDTIKVRVNNHYSGERAELLRIINKSVKDILKSGTIIGLGLALLVTLISLKFLGPFSVIPGLISFLAGVLLTEKVIENEYKRWQGKIFAGIPSLINFVPAFLELEGITAREALSNTLNFLPEPLKSEMWLVVDKIKRTGQAKQTLNEFSQKVKDPLMDAVCFRLSAAWDTKITADLFNDLSDQVEEMVEKQISKATVAKTGLLALICVFGLIGFVLVYGYPGIAYLMEKLSAGFGI